MTCLPTCQNAAEIFQSMDFLCQECKRGVNDFVSEIKRAENYPDFEKLAHVTQHGLQEVIVENIEGESTEANDLGHIL